LAVFCLLPLAACSNSPWAQSLERSIAADPQLQTNAEGSATPTGTAELPANFPSEIPRYPNAELLEVTSGDAASASGGVNQTTLTRWSTSDTADQIRQFYQSQLNENGWKILQPASNPTPDQPIAAEKDGLRAIVTLRSPIVAPSPTTGTSGTTPTEFTIAYQLSDSTTAASPQANGSSSTPNPGDSEFVGPVLPGNSVTQSPSPSGSPAQIAGTPTNFSDVNQAPAALRSYITDLAQLGALPIRSDGRKSSNPNEFKPNQQITRREYAQWLVTANNLIFANQPARQIRLGSSSDQPAFQDIKPSDPDFGAIQGLANAGLIPSPLSGASTIVTFRPDAPLTREDLILWKVPVDLRSALPNASIDAVEKTWGFQDAARIEPQALRAVLADYQNGDQANIRRAFAYTTLFQPKKPVSRAEAAAVLWHFGSQADGVSAKDTLQGGGQPKPVGP
jgi:hypothetical protein